MNLVHFQNNCPALSNARKCPIQQNMQFPGLGLWGKWFIMRCQWVQYDCQQQIAPWVGRADRAFCFQMSFKGICVNFHAWVCMKSCRFHLKNGLVRLFVLHRASQVLIKDKTPHTTFAGGFKSKLWGYYGGRDIFRGNQLFSNKVGLLFQKVLKEWEK